MITVESASIVKEGTKMMTDVVLNHRAEMRVGYVRPSPGGFFASLSRSRFVENKNASGAECATHRSVDYSQCDLSVLSGDQNRTCTPPLG